MTTCVQELRGSQTDSKDAMVVLVRLLGRMVVGVGEGSGAGASL